MTPRLWQVSTDQDEGVTVEVSEANIDLTEPVYVLKSDYDEMAAMVHSTDMVLKEGFRDLVKAINHLAVIVTQVRKSL